MGLPWDLTQGTATPIFTLAQVGTRQFHQEGKWGLRQRLCRLDVRQAQLKGFQGLQAGKGTVNRSSFPSRYKMGLPSTSGFEMPVWQNENDQGNLSDVQISGQCGLNMGGGV